MGRRKGKLCGRGRDRRIVVCLRTLSNDRRPRARNYHMAVGDKGQREVGIDEPMEYEALRD